MSHGYSHKTLSTT